MKDISIEQIDEVKNGKSIVLLWAEGCHACEGIKSFFDDLASKYTEFNFYKLQYDSDIMPFYTKYIPKEEAYTQARYENGDLILTVDNKPLMILKVDINNEPILESPLLFPNFLIFTEDMQDGENEHGFLGNIPGSQKEQVEYILGEMSINSTLDFEQRSIYG